MSETVSTKPIIFQPWKVKRILAWDFEKQGNMQTRRILKPQPDAWAERFELGPFKDGGATCGRPGDWLQMTADAYKIRGLSRSRYGVPGEELWVREKFLITHPGGGADDPWAAGEPIEYVGKLPSENPSSLLDGWWSLHYFADASLGDGWQWRNSLFMPMWASRLRLKIVSMRIERLQSITTSDCIAEGVEDEEWLDFREYAESVAAAGSHIQTLKEHFSNVWDKINSKKVGFAWEFNPWVVVIEFNRSVGVDHGQVP